MEIEDRPALTEGDKLIVSFLYVGLGIRDGFALSSAQATSWRSIVADFMPIPSRYGSEK
jgi:hypothetical protein